MTEQTNQDATEQAAMTGSFTGEAVETTPEPTKAPEQKAVAETPAPSAPPTRKYRKITEDDYQSFKKLAEAFPAYQAEVQKKFDTSFGKMGQYEQRLREVSTLLTDAPEDLPDEVVEDMKTDYPDLAPYIQKVLNRAHKIQRGKRGDTKAAEAKPNDPTPATDKAAGDHGTLAEQQALLESEHPDWRDVVGTKPNGEINAEAAFRKWLDTKPPTYRHKVSNANEAYVLAEALTAFKADQAAKTNDKAAQRQERVRESINPRGTAQPPGALMSEADAMRKAFASA